MVTNRLLIDIVLPEGNWARDVTIMQPDILIQVEEQMMLDDNIAALRITIQGSGSKQALQILENNELVQFTAIYEEMGKNIELSIIAEGMSILHKSLKKSGQILQTPYVIKDGHATWTFLTDRNGALKVKDALKEFAIEHQIIAFGAHRDTRLLTPRQRDIFDAAVYNGYYDKPRRITLTKLADNMEISKSALCEMMHLIEKNIMQNFAEEVRMMSPMG